jgi:hypothetical protein
MMELKWSTGEKYKRTPRQYKVNNSENINNTSETRVGAIQQSLMSETEIDNMWTMSMQQGQEMNHLMSNPNKREDSYNRMAEREMMCQVNRNPFMPDRNYLEDVMVQDQFLKPQSTFLEKETNKNTYTQEN